MDGFYLQTIEGVVSACEWDETSNVIRVRISCNGHTDYIVDKKNQMVDYLTDTVKLKGHVYKRQEQNYISIQSILGRRTDIPK